ncbi:hypothetical protein D3C87_2075350 [compost metagenome]
MDRAGDQFLAGPRFAVDQHAGIGGGDHVDLFDDFFDRLALTDDFAEVVLDVNLFLQVRVLLFQAIL